MFDVRCWSFVIRSESNPEPDEACVPTTNHEPPLNQIPLTPFHFSAFLNLVSRKSAKIAALIESQQGQDRDAHYLGFFECFNQGLYYEAHDVLEELWLAQGKSGANYAFYKGLIQLAGAFVHLQKNRLGPAVALFNLSEANLRQYPSRHEDLDLDRVLHLIREWRAPVESGGGTVNPLTSRAAPVLRLDEANPAPEAGD